jgi:hypothetical protein
MAPKPFPLTTSLGFDPDFEAKFYLRFSVTADQV